MKTITFLAAAALMLGNAAIAKASGVSLATTMTRFSLDEPIEFTERGITFFVFPNGEFDFNTTTTTAQPLYYRNGRRGTNATYGAPAGVRIEHDAMGRVRRIGNVFLNYDNQNRIKRVGSVYMTYNRFALTQVGNLRILYNRRGQIINIVGNVKGYTVPNRYGYQYQNDQDDEDDTIYYKGAETPANQKEK